MNENVTLIKRGSGIVECRICGQVFLPEMERDKEEHEAAHRRILWGGFPYEIREMLKRAGWEAIEDQELSRDEHGRRQVELGKRAVVYGWWARAMANGIPESELEGFMAAHLAYLDAEDAKDEEAIEAAKKEMRRWRKYGG